MPPRVSRPKIAEAPSMTDITLREYIEKVIELKFKAYDDALSLQAREYTRRLEALNGEAQKLTTMQASYVGREVYDAKIKELDTLTNELKISKEVLAAKAGVPMVIISWVASVIGIVLSIIALADRFAH